MSNILDTRDLQERLDELAELKEAVESAQALVDELMTSDLAAAQPDFDEKLDEARTELDTACVEFDSSEQKELEELESLCDEIPEWHEGTQLIPVDDFVDYCQELCEDIGDIPKEIPSYIVIDWEATAKNLAADYSECEYQGESYYYRSC